MLNDNYFKESLNDERMRSRAPTFQHLHMNIFETLGYATAVQETVEATGHDIEIENPNYQQLLRDYQITKHLCNTNETPLEKLCSLTEKAMAKQNQAYASYAQLYAAATNAMTHWRILSEIPEDIRQKESMTHIVKEKLNKYIGIWQYILIDLEVEQI